MLRGLYTAAAGMLATTVATDTIANNLANVGTVGYKNNKVNFQSFPEMMIQRMGGGESAPMGSLMTGSKVRQTYINFLPGSLRQTGNTFDLAIEGDGFFTVKTPDGQTCYTRAGNFMVNDAGFLTTVNGDYVQGELGNIQLNLDEAPFQINTQGEVTARGRLIDRIKIGRFENNQALEKVGDTLFKAGPAAQAVAEPPAGAPLGYRIYQGQLEQANVNPVLELVNNIQGMRLYEALQKNIHLSNETLGRAVNDVGRPSR